jgi:hypothetical protein
MPPEAEVATPLGSIPLSELVEGDLVYSVHDGGVRAVPVAVTNRTRVQDHQMLRISLAGGRVLVGSPGHPMADGRRFDQLRPGDELDGVAVTGLELIPFSGEYTYDILPASDSGSYFVEGLRIGSSLVF